MGKLHLSPISDISTRHIVPDYLKQQFACWAHLWKAEFFNLIGTDECFEVGHCQSTYCYCNYQSAKIVDRCHYVRQVFTVALTILSDTKKKKEKKKGGRALSTIWVDHHILEKYFLFFATASRKHKHGENDNFEELRKLERWVKLGKSSCSQYTISCGYKLVEIALRFSLIRRI